MKRPCTGEIKYNLALCNNPAPRIWPPIYIDDGDQLVYALEGFTYRQRSVSRDDVRQAGEDLEVSKT